MSDATATARIPASAQPVGRSLWQDAWRRLKRNRAAIASAAVLLLIALAGIVGPFVTPHPYDRIYSQYVRAPASFEAYPREETIVPQFVSALERARVTIGESLSIREDDARLQTDRLTSIRPL